MSEFGRSLGTVSEKNMATDILRQAEGKVMRDVERNQNARNFVKKILR